ncbi:MAG TPA: hypothetical protein VJY54_04240 [Lachnospiraceae bacterium]|nr:hypothetical protein [Lachnospiraceae bacterium]
MYLRDKSIKILMMKNFPLAFLGIFNLVLSVYVMLSLIATYHDQMEVILYARATPDCIFSFMLGIIFLSIAVVSKRMIEDANFYSSYFEADLDGYIEYGDLAEVMGKKEFFVKWQMHFFRKVYMKNYELKVIDRKEQIVLESKICTCNCKNCGALIEKRIYFTGSCPYCGSSDLFANVLTDNRFYSISNTLSEGEKKPQYYSANNLYIKKILFLIFFAIGACVIAIVSLMCLSNFANYNNEAYLKEVLLSGTGPSSFALIKEDIMDLIIFGAIVALAFIPVVYNNYKKIRYIFTTDICSKFFSKCKKPFVDPYKLPAVKDRRNVFKYVRGAIRRRYLLHCTFEKHDGLLLVALAKKIVKDECPSCGGAIVGAIDEHYKCRYCGNIIMDVVRRK